MCINRAIKNQTLSFQMFILNVISSEGALIAKNYSQKFTLEQIQGKWDFFGNCDGRGGIEEGEEVGKKIWAAPKLVFIRIQEPSSPEVGRQLKAKPCHAKWSTFTFTFCAGGSKLIIAQQTNSVLLFSFPYKRHISSNFLV